MIYDSTRFLFSFSSNNSGDNPSCVDGPPVTLDWAHDPHTMFVLDVNTFERMRGERRPMSQMVISRTVREKTYVFLVRGCVLMMLPYIALLFFLWVVGGCDVFRLLSTVGLMIVH
jgi:hypothetical protein